MQQTIAVFEFLALVALLATRAVLLRRKGIIAIVFGKTHKSDVLLLIPMVLLGCNVLWAAFGKRLPFASSLNLALQRSEAVMWLGVAVSGVAVLAFYSSVKALGDSFRVGIDVDKPDRLVTTGIYARTRNPIYLCFFAFFIGMTLITTTPLMLFLMLLIFLAVHRQVLREEAFLRDHYGPDFDAYCKKVRRYI